MVTTMIRLSRSLVCHFVLCFVAAAVLLAPAMTSASTAGPDPAGYTATDAAVYSFIDIAGANGAVSILGGEDDATAALTLPFPLTFYGQDYSVVCVSSNGALYLVANAAACDGLNDFANTDLQTTAPPTDPPAILPFWSDLSFGGAGAGSVYYQTTGATGSRKFIIQWNNALPAGSAAPVTFQVVLTEASRRVLFQYKTVDLGLSDPASKGGQATIGIRNAFALTNHEQLPWSFAVPVVEDESVVSFDTGVKTAPVIIWTSPAAIVYGTALGGTQLNATADVPGAFAYTPPAGTILDAGNARVLKTTFTPTDSARYSTADAAVAIDVNRAPLVVTPADATKVFGDTFTAFSGTLATVVAGDPITAGYSSTGAAAGAAVGSYPITATLNDPNNRLPNYAVTLKTGVLKVMYNATTGHRFLEPLADGRERVEPGATIPVKFQLFGIDGTTPVTTASATLTVTQLSACSGPPAGGTIATVPFRFDPRARQYIANLRTARTWCGTFRLTATLDDGSTIVATIDVGRERERDVRDRDDRDRDDRDRDDRDRNDRDRNERDGGGRRR